MDRSRRAVFTIIELMVTVRGAAILRAIATPNMRTFLPTNRLTSGVNDLLHSIQVARTEAIKRQRGSVVVCGTTDPAAGTAALTCTYDTFRGLFVLQDTNGNWQRDAGEPVIETHTLIDASVTVKPDANGDIVSFGPSSFANPAGAKVPTATLVMCDVRGVTAVGNNSTGRALFITATGRARASASYAEVHNTALPLVVGGSCP